MRTSPTSFVTNYQRKDSWILLLHLLILSLFACQEEKKTTPPKTETSAVNTFLNHSDSAKYVGIQTCRTCHFSIYEHFIQTGMGQSIDLATKSKSAGDFSRSEIHDTYTDFSYKAYWENDHMFIRESRPTNTFGPYTRTEEVNYIIGSGQHTNSHLCIRNGYITQMPMTYYTQKKEWHLPPGFENGVNTRFSRKIGLECMSCHNGYPDFVLGSENKYSSIPNGIDCERCHGPGSIHVQQKSSGALVDTSRYIDYSIVNPAKLPLDRQFDVCMRCHLQGNAVLKNGKSFYDYKPGMVLSDYLTVFLPKYENDEEHFIMASHADRLKQSQCFIQSAPKAGKDHPLRPYKDALTCVTCHNPHISVKQTNGEKFNQACQKCHSTHTCTSPAFTSKKEINCVKCHMPSSGSTDIPHVSIHDHYIRKPEQHIPKKEVLKFLGLYAINERKPDRKTKIKAYLQQFEKTEPKSYYLDSALVLLHQEKESKAVFHEWVHFDFLKKDIHHLTQLINAFGRENILQNLCVQKSFDNAHAWTAYRIGQMLQDNGDATQAIPYMEKAKQLAPYFIEISEKLAGLYAQTGAIEKAKTLFEFCLQENPNYLSTYNDYGFMLLSIGKLPEAEQLFLKGLQIDPDFPEILLNYASILHYKNDRTGCKKTLQHLLKRHPHHSKAQQIFKNLFP